MMMKYRGKALRPVYARAAIFLLIGLFLAGDAAAQMPADIVSGASETGAHHAAAYAMAEPVNVTVNFRDVDIHTVLRYLSDASGVDIVPHPEVEGLVTMRLTDKPWEDVLSIVTRNHDCVYSWEGDIIRVVPSGRLGHERAVTQVIQLKNLAREIELRRAGSLADDVAVEESEIAIQQLMSAINSLLDRARGENATFISAVNSIVVTAIPSKMDTIKRIIEDIDRRPAQIVLDAKVVEIRLNKDERFGVDWNAVMSAAGARRPITFPFTHEGILPFFSGDPQRRFVPSYGAPGADQNVRFPYLDATDLLQPTGDALTPDDVFTFGTLDFSTFRATLRLIDERGDSEILSSPRITTLNNQRATIKVIQKLMLQESVRATDTGTTLAVQFESEEDAREIGVKLTVIPRVNERGEITVNLLPEVSSDPVFDEIDALAGQTVALRYNSREANTIVRVNDGETIFLGGLISRDVVKRENKLPILGDIFGGIPILGNAFKYEAEQVLRTEIVFFVTVHLVKDTLDSFDLTDTREFYERYITREGRDKFGDMVDPSGREVPGPWIGRGRLKETEDTQVIEISPRTQEQERTRKPFLDFRKN